MEVPCFRPQYARSSDNFIESHFVVSTELPASGWLAFAFGLIAAESWSESLSRSAMPEAVGMQQELTQFTKLVGAKMAVIVKAINLL